MCIGNDVLAVRLRISWRRTDDIGSVVLTTSGVVVVASVVAGVGANVLVVSCTRGNGDVAGSICGN
jgi:hypothetical protein